MVFEFDVNEQTLTRTDKSKAVTDSVGYLTAKFNFITTDWSNMIKTAVFKVGNKVYTKLLDDNNSCIIPYEVLTRGSNGFINLKISVFGVDGAVRIPTNEKTIRIDASGYSEGETPEDPTPDIYSEILNVCKEAVEKVDDVRDNIHNYIDEAILGEEW